MRPMRHPILTMGNSMTTVKIKKIISGDVQLKVDLMGEIREAVPKINVALKILEPTTFPTAIMDLP